MLLKFHIDDSFHNLNNLKPEVKIDSSLLLHFVSFALHYNRVGAGTLSTLAKTLTRGKKYNSK
jgi:hypothetical protein